MSRLRVFNVFLLCGFYLSTFSQEQIVNTVAGDIILESEQEIPVLIQGNDIVFNDVENLSFDYDLFDGHPIRISSGTSDQVMMIGSGNSGVGIQGFFSRLSNSAIIFEGEKVQVECITNNVRNSGSGKYRISVTSENGSIKIRQIKDMLSSKDAPCLGESFGYLDTPFDYIPMSRYDREKGPLMGICTWAFYLQSITEKDVLEIGHWMNKNFAPFGADVLQIDDGWQYHGLGGLKGKGDFRISHPKKFPSGIKSLSKQLNSMGIELGLWMLANYNSSPELLKEHPDWFMKNSKGEPAVGKWPGYLLDVTNPELWEKYYIPLFEKARNEWHVKYWKFDGLKWPGRHLYNDSYNPVSDEKQVEWRFYDTRYMPEDLTDVNAAYNLWMQKLRALSGPDTYVLACQGPAYWSSGAVSASRFTGDVFGEDGQLQTLASSYAKYLPLHSNSFWLDPDHLLLGQISPKEKRMHSIEKSRLWASMVALTGSVVMAGDKVTELPQERLELYHQIMPIVPVHPIEFRKISTKPIWSLNIKRDFDEWTVVSLFNFNDSDSGNVEKIEVKPSDLGLNDDEYLVWNYFRKELVNSRNGDISYMIKPMTNELLSFHKKLGHPQVISTTRHLTQGGVELENVVWGDNNSLTIEALTIEDYDYDIIVYVPNKYTPVSANFDYVFNKQKNIMIVKIKSSNSGKVQLKVGFE